MKIIKEINESLDNPNLSEDISSDDLYQKLIEFINEELQSVLYDIDVKAEDNVPPYDKDWFESKNSSQIGHSILTAAEFMAEDLLRDAPDMIEESLMNEDIDTESFSGKLLKDFLRQIDHRSRVKVDSENGYELDGGIGNTAGMSGLAHDIGWYLADKVIKSVKRPENSRFYDYEIVVEDCDSDDDKEILQEKNWKHQLSMGGRLRRAIEEENYELIKELLIAAYKEIHEVDPENFDEYDLDSAIDDIEILDTEPDEEIDIDESDIEANFDMELGNFYDICDSLDIWIPLDESLETELTEADLHPNIKKEIKRAYKSFDSKLDQDKKGNRDLKKTIRKHAIENIPDKEERAQFIKSGDKSIDDVFPTKSKTKFVPPSRGDKVERNDYPFYVTYYAEYPIYEPAEGGYYYAGANAVYSKGFETKEEAEAHLKELAEEEDMDIVNDDYAQINTKYIGEQDHIVVETRKDYLSGESGYVPYS